MSSPLSGPGTERENSGTASPPAAPPVPGPVVLFGSGETEASGRRAYARVFASMTPPVRVAILETPAGFEPNSPAVAAKVARFLEERLGAHQPDPTVVPARRRGPGGSTEDPALAPPILTADAIFLGPGSPSYAVRHLRDSYIWNAVRASHRQGAALLLASAASIAVSRWSLPVYEIFKVGADLHWLPGLDLLADYGIGAVFVPHWNNRQGGRDLDTRHCYMGEERFRRLLDLLDDTPVVGLDEHTALILDLTGGYGEVVGRGQVTVLTASGDHVAAAGERFELAAAGLLGPVGGGEVAAGSPSGIPEAIWHLAELARVPAPATPAPPDDALRLAEERAEARVRRQWCRADDLRQQLVALGWEVRDTEAGYTLVPI